MVTKMTRIMMKDGSKVYFKIEELTNKDEWVEKMEQVPYDKGLIVTDHGDGHITLSTGEGIEARALGWDNVLKIYKMKKEGWHVDVKTNPRAQDHSRAQDQNDIVCPENN